MQIHSHRHLRRKAERRATFHEASVRELNAKVQALEEERLLLLQRDVEKATATATAGAATEQGQDQGPSRQELEQTVANLSAKVSSFQEYFLTD